MLIYLFSKKVCLSLKLHYVTPYLQHPVVLIIIHENWAMVIMLYFVTLAFDAIADHGANLVFVLSIAIISVLWEASTEKYS